MESILDKTDNQLMTLEKLVMDIEFSQVEKTVLEGLQTGNQALKQLHDILSIDKIESILDETKEGIEKQKVCLNLWSLFFIVSYLIFCFK
jgi:charged multivesicular body protein 6